MYSFEVLVIGPIVYRVKDNREEYNGYLHHSYFTLLNN